MAYDNVEMPYRLETGTIAMEAVVGAAEAVEFIADIGRQHSQYFEEETAALSGRRKRIVSGLLAIDKYEEALEIGRAHV